MTTVLNFHRLDDDPAGLARYSIFRDDNMGPCAYLHIDAGALEIVPLMASAPLLLNALKECVDALTLSCPDGTGPGCYALHVSRAAIAEGG